MLQLREARAEAAAASKAGEDTARRLRALLAHARTLLREAGVAFMEEDAQVSETVPCRLALKPGLP